MGTGHVASLCNHRYHSTVGQQTDHDPNTYTHMYTHVMVNS